ncbi:hypothetical protein F511_42745 [Dorcoceras hygrometricum]|uniref:Uncharacterized protein n=1 Tax=Dorcoceras hygrometricum TaxID=472368 RepID=A0A2Z7DCU8_9LAMI|nr:hypothetical protein F511_42745 [Dorcoceras hygrometricum]
MKSQRWISSFGPGPVGPSAAPPPLQKPPPPPPCAAARFRRKIVSGQFDEENPFVLISSVLLVQADDGVSFLVVDRIGDIYRNLPRRADVIVTTVGARYKCQQGWNRHGTVAHGGAPPCAKTRAIRAHMAGVSSHVANKISALAASCLRDEADGRRRVLRDVGWPMNAGRTLAARLPRKERPGDAASGAKGCASKRAARSTMMRPLLHTAASIVRRWADEAPLLVGDGCLAGHLSGTCAWLQPVFQEPGASRLIAVDSSIRSTTRLEAPSSDCTRSPDEISTIGFSTKN